MYILTAGSLKRHIGRYIEMWKNTVLRQNITELGGWKEVLLTIERQHCDKPWFKSPPADQFSLDNRLKLSYSTTNYPRVAQLIERHR